MNSAHQPLVAERVRRSRRLPLPRLIYEQPSWRRALLQSFARSKRPAVRWDGNVAQVAWRPLGFGLVEIAPGEWALAWMRAGSKPEPFSERGADREVAQYHLAHLWITESRPLYPPAPLGLGSRERARASGSGAETIGGTA